MSTPQDDDILFRAGATTLLKYGVPWRRRRWDPLEVEGPTFTRADATTCATFFGSDGLLRLALANRARLTYGDPAASLGAALLLEAQRINVVLHNRDLTNAAWVKVSCTPVKDEVGIDGLTNSASRLTATAGNGTCLQAITGGGSTRITSAYVKRLIGAGDIQMTQDGGGIWTTIAVTASWVRFNIPAGAMGNQSLGFRIVTNGDSVAIDFVQNEVGTYATSPIPTTTGTVTRVADALPFPIGFSQPKAGDELSLYVKFDAAWPRTGSDGTAPGVFTVGGIGAFAIDGLSAWDCHRATGSAQVTVRSNANAATAQVVSLNLPASGVMELLTQLRANGSLHELYAELSGNSGVSSTHSVAPYPWRARLVQPGDRGNSSDPGNLFLYDLIVARGRFVTADFQGVV